MQAEAIPVQMGGQVEIHLIGSTHNHPGNDEEYGVPVRFRTQTGADEPRQGAPLSRDAE
jgi:hypothetical protein